jgi:hypothetical protein
MGKTSRKIDWLFILSLIIFSLLIASFLFFEGYLFTARFRSSGEPWGALPLVIIRPALISGAAAAVMLAYLRRRGSRFRLRAYCWVFNFAFLLYAVVGDRATEYVSGRFFADWIYEMDWFVSIPNLLVSTVMGLVAGAIGRLFARPIAALPKSETD